MLCTLPWLTRLRLVLAAVQHLSGASVISAADHVPTVADTGVLGGGAVRMAGGKRLLELRGAVEAPTKVDGDGVRWCTRRRPTASLLLHAGTESALEELERVSQVRLAGKCRTVCPLNDVHNPHRPAWPSSRVWWARHVRWWAAAPCGCTWQLLYGSWMRTLCGSRCRRRRRRRERESDMNGKAAVNQCCTLSMRVRRGPHSACQWRLLPVIKPPSLLVLSQMCVPCILHC